MSSAASKSSTPRGAHSADEPSTKAGAGNRRLLLLTPSLSFGGGIERMAKSVATAWPGAVTRVDLYHPDETTTPEGNLRAKVRFVRRALIAAARQRPAVVMALHVNFLPVALLIGVFARARVAMFGIGVEVWVRFPRWKRLLLGRCGRLLAISSFTAQWMARYASIDPERIRVVLLPVDHRFAREALAEGSVTGPPDAEHSYLLTVTRLVPQDRFKGCFDVAEALPQVLAERPEVRWVVVGQGADLPALRARCESLGVDQAVNFTGGIEDEDLIEAYRCADVFLLPSKADPEAVPPIGEGFGLVFAEAGAFGLPSIGSAWGGGSLEFVKDGETGLLVPPSDPQALARAILRLVDDAELRVRLGQRAKERVAAHHLPSRFSAELWDACL